MGAIIAPFQKPWTLREEVFCVVAVSLIVYALNVGESAHFHESVRSAAKDAYAELLGRIRRLFAGSPFAEEVLEQYLTSPNDAHRVDSLAAELERVGAASDAEVVATARRLIDLVEHADWRKLEPEPAPSEPVHIICV